MSIDEGARRPRPIRAGAYSALATVRRVVTRSVASRLGAAGVVILLAFATIAVLAPAFAPHDPTVPTGAPFERPSGDHLLGTNDIGQDLFSELIFGARVSLAIGFSVAAIAICVGATIGLVAGQAGGGVDATLMRLVDLTLALPFLPLLLVVSVFLGQSVITTVLVISSVLWARPARVVRSLSLSLRERGPTQAALAMGASRHHLLSRHIGPSAVPLIVAELVRTANIAILIEASLSFLGLGDPTQKTWGTMLFFANTRGAFITGSWLWWVLPTGLVIGLVATGLALVGFAIEEWADPRLRAGQRAAYGQRALTDTPAVLQAKQRSGRQAS